mgnify:CR=1 FL=1
MDAIARPPVTQRALHWLKAATATRGGKLRTIASALLSGTTDDADAMARMQFSAPADIGERHAVFQPCHGSAPDIAGKGLANPIAQTLSYAMMLRYSFDLGKDADMVELAVENAITLASREHRGCFGKSSGGYGAIIHGMKYPETWGAIADHSGDAYFDFCYMTDWPRTLNELDRYRKPTSRGRYRNVYRLLYPTYAPPRAKSAVPEM